MKPSLETRAPPSRRVDLQRKVCERSGKSQAISCSIPLSLARYWQIPATSLFVSYSDCAAEVIISSRNHGRNGIVHKNVKWRKSKFPFLGEQKEDRSAEGTLGMNLKEGKLVFFLKRKTRWKVPSSEETQTTWAACNTFRS